MAYIYSVLSYQWQLGNTSKCEHHSWKLWNRLSFWYGLSWGFSPKTLTWKGKETPLHLKCGCLLLGDVNRQPQNRKHCPCQELYRRGPWKQPLKTQHYESSHLEPTSPYDCSKRERMFLTSSSCSKSEEMWKL